MLNMRFWPFPTSEKVRLFICNTFQKEKSPLTSNDKCSNNLWLLLLAWKLYLASYFQMSVDTRTSIFMSRQQKCRQSPTLAYRFSFYLFAHAKPTSCIENVAPCCERRFKKVFRCVYVDWIHVCLELGNVCFPPHL